MARQLLSSRTTALSILLLLALLWYYWGRLFPKELDKTDVVLMRKGSTMDNYKFLYVGVKNVCKSSPNQYKNFLPKVAISIADTIHEDVNIYFLIYDRQIEHHAKNWTPFKLEEEAPDSFLLRTHWNSDKKTTSVHWYITDLKSLNTEIPDPLHLHDTRVEQSK